MPHFILGFSSLGMVSRVSGLQLNYKPCRYKSQVQFKIASTSLKFYRGRPNTLVFLSLHHRVDCLFFLKVLGESFFCILRQAVEQRTSH